MEPAEDSPALAERYRAARYTTFDNVMPAEWIGAAGEWLHSQRGLFTRGGDDGRGQFNFELPDVDDLYAPIGQLKAAIASHISDAVKQIGTADFDLGGLDCHAALYHHGGHYAWHTDAPLPTTQGLAYALYLHSSPKMFRGGELEFLDGTMVDPTNNRLVMFDPHQQHRVRRVECWSADFLHGRWALFGWVHGQPPGSTEHLSGKPLSG